MAAIGIALWKFTLSPLNPDYFNRDKFILSNGHTCLFQYVFQNLAEYLHMTMDQLKMYHSRDPHGSCLGHSEIEFPGIEITTDAHLEKGSLTLWKWQSLRKTWPRHIQQARFLSSVKPCFCHSWRCLCARRYFS